MPVKPDKAMVLAAGLGLRMRPLTDRMPKPLVSVGGRPLLDHVLDKLGDAGVSEAIVNVHYLPDQIIEHVKTRKRPRVIISDERDLVLGTGGGVVKALPLLGDAPFYHLNADTLWIDGVRPNLARLAAAGHSGRSGLFEAIDLPTSKSNCLSAIKPRRGTPWLHRDRHATISCVSHAIVWAHQVEGRPCPRSPRSWRSRRLRFMTR